MLIAHKSMRRENVFGFTFISCKFVCFSATPKRLHPFLQNDFYESFLLIHTSAEGHVVYEKEHSARQMLTKISLKLSILIEEDSVLLL